MEASLNMKLNPNRRIGKVLYLVEGDVDEVIILERIFSKVFNYSVIAYDKRLDNVTYLVKPDDKFSKVFIVPMKYSAVSKIESSTDYIEYIYQRLKKFGLEKEECARYLLFDRDEGSNSHEMLEHLFSVFKNSLDNDLEINGLLLLSYPCVQSFYCECFNDRIRLSSSSLMKMYTSKYNINNIDGVKLLNGAESMIRTILSIANKPSFDMSNLDDMQLINVDILNYQDECFATKRVYNTLSLLFISLIDLGIIEL